ncbi:MAG TPA: homocysteine S-methyltransferase family protein [Baekduia sp.]|nr:homocysteine S-methyltransferase family protein [Baekduia sp.]
MGSLTCPAVSEQVRTRTRSNGSAAQTGYDRITAKLSAGRCVILDGGVAAELPDLKNSERAYDERPWGTRAIVEDEAAVRAVHRAYAEAGCDVISTNTWGLPTAVAEDAAPLGEAGRPLKLMDLARRGLRAAREGIAEAGRDDVAVAFSLNGDVDQPGGDETIKLLSRLFAEDKPDLILVETLSVVRPSLYSTVESLLGTGVPVWLSFRRCPEGLCGVFGQHWGGPEGDAFGRAVRRFEEMGVGAVLINCIPPDHVPGMVSYLRDFTDIPLGVYPNLGYFTADGWKSDAGVGAAEYAAMALSWREEGAQIIGGCCGVGASQIAAAAKSLEGTRAGAARREPAAASEEPSQSVGASWSDRKQGRLYPLPLPEIVSDPGVAQPTTASFMAWKYLHREGIGAHQRCLDIGCGSGLLAVQLALNGARHVRAIDVDPAAVVNTETNAFRNGVADRVTAATIDLYPWVPEERYEVVVASLDQTPVDPFQHPSTHRPVDYWGRSLVDQLIAKLSDALAPEGVAYIVHLSILSERRTIELLAEAGYTAEVVDYELFNLPAQMEDSRTQIRRVEELSDAYHVRLGDQDVLVAYLLEVRPSAPEARLELD